MPKTRNVFPAPGERIWLAVIAGVIYWAVCLVAWKFLYPVIESQSLGNNIFSVFGTILMIALVCLLLLGIHFAVRGCNIWGQYRIGTNGYFIKWFALLVVFTILGLIAQTFFYSYTRQIAVRIFNILITAIVLTPPVFWTGRGLSRRVYKVPIS